MKSVSTSALLAALLVAATSTSALAQEKPRPRPVLPQSAAPADPILPQTCTDEVTGEERPCENLSEKLGETGSVIEPPPVNDPGIQVPAPDPTPNTTPVIPPSALPEQQPPPEDDVIRQ